jgi:hypothetical protein
MAKQVAEKMCQLHFWKIKQIPQAVTTATESK